MRSGAAPETQDDLWHDLALQAWRRAIAAIDPAENRRWLERAHRMMPLDGMIATTLAGALLRDGDVVQAAALFRAEAERHGTMEAWTGLAACAHLRGDPAAARVALEAALRISVPTATIRTLAATIAPGGWCGLTPAGLLHAGPVLPTKVSIDGVVVPLAWCDGTARLPEGWRGHRTIDVATPSGAALGSPLPIPPFAGIEGFVEAVAGGISGWAWQPTDPAARPVLHIQGPGGARTLPLDTVDEAVTLGRPFAQPRGFRLGAAETAEFGTPLALRGPDGRHLLGSPLDPGLEVRAAAAPGHAGFAPVWADVRGPAQHRGPVRRPVDVVIPVYRGLVETLACLDSVLASLPRGSRVIVVDDASPDAALAASLDRLARRRRITVLRLTENRGFPGAANAGLAAAAGRDVVLLNADTLVPPGWLERLRAAAYGAPDIGTVTPLSNDATILSYPDVAGGNRVPDLDGTVAMDALAVRANGTATVDIPVGVGFCLYLRRDCLDDIGQLREDLFAQGYGEENDLCLRARHHGWRNAGAPGVFVAHVGGTSFGGARAHLVRRNAAILARLHPGYDALVDAHVAADPLLPARRAMDGLRWTEGRCRAGAVVLVTHAGGGGVDRVIAERVVAIVAQGRRAIVLRPAQVANGPGVRVQQPDAAAMPNLVFPLPAGLPDLVALLRPDKVRRVELHHMLGHDATLAGLAQALRAPAVSVVHDYARFCPRIALVSTERRYCGEPDIPGCEACIADLGSLLEDDPPVRTLLARSAAELSAATRVVAPSHDAAARLRRHFPAVQPEVEPWEDDAAWPPLSPAAAASVTRVAIVGAIGVEKGFEVLLGCARDAGRRGLPLEFVVVGYTADDARLMEAGPVFVTGKFAEADAVALIRAQAAQLALIPSVWPETWCYALSRAWAAGLPAAVFDLGAQAERVRRTGRGWLLPLGLPPRGLNDALLRLAPAVPASQCPPHSG